MKEIDRLEVAKIICGLKYCSNWNSCSTKRCSQNAVNIFNPDDERMDYVMKTMQEHSLSETDLERLLVAYKWHFAMKEENEDTLIGKIRKIYLLFELQSTELPYLGSDVCSLV